MNKARETLTLLRNDLSGDDLKKLTPEELRQFRELCHHWAAMAEPKRPSNAAA